MTAFIRNSVRMLDNASFKSGNLTSKALQPYSNLYAQRAAPMVSRSLSTTKDSTQGSETDQNNSSDSGKPLGKVSGIVNSILHGSGSLPKIQSQESWGVSLARGKYVHELQRHRIRPERYDDYIQLVSEAFPRMVKESNNKIRLTGSWLTEIGELDTAGKFFKSP
ncbi:hypothetical protein BGZ46_004679 [Entomortierella lignicola]|nr:hypothetical protein BGZ46_004679 [Entomortierella lignicola]KAF9206176.1 hypothetical protein BGZ49_002881 [Haplosporangium sp. Z 27]